jgi:hypothetical protein
MNETTNELKRSVQLQLVDLLAKQADLQDQLEEVKNAVREGRGVLRALTALSASEAKAAADAIIEE